jgi:hypothetical protein
MRSIVLVAVLSACRPAPVMPAALVSVTPSTMPPCDIEAQCVGGGGHASPWILLALLAVPAAVVAAHFLFQER